MWWRSTSSVPLLSGGTTAPTLASGTTLAAMQAGSCSLKYTLAIEGYQYLLTDATPQQAIDAWYDETSTARYTQALGGLFISSEISQQLVWTNPFTRGGRLMFTVAQTDTGDTFGVDTHKRNASAETTLTSTVDRDDTTINVTSTTGFASSGEIWIGTECIGYTGITATSFTGCTRGKYAPLCNGNSGAGWAQTHRVGAATSAAHNVQLKPRVTNIPVKWIGKWVAVYLHRFDASIPALNSKDNAQLVFCGTIESIADDPATGMTTVEVKHVLDRVGEHTVGGRDPWSGKIKNTIYVGAGQAFYMRDRQSVGGLADSRTANSLIVKPSGASGANEMNAGYYTAEELFAKLNLWFSSEKFNNRLFGTYSIGFYQPTGGFQSVYFFWSNPAATTVNCEFIFGMPEPVRQRFGFANNAGTEYASNGFGTSATRSPTDIGSTPHAYVADEYYRKFTIDTSQTVLSLIDQRGTFVSQTDYLPSGLGPTGTGINLAQWGIFMVDESLLIVAAWDGAGGLLNVKVLPNQYGLTDNTGFEFQERPLKTGETDTTAIRQIFVLELPFGDALKRIFKSTGTNGYNDATWDTFAYGLGIALPHDITDATFLASIDALPHADKPVNLIIDKTIRLGELLAGELILRRAFLRWKNERLEFATWKTPTAGTSAGTLTEANKAAPAGTSDHQRSVTLEDGSWAVPIQKIQYNRTLKSSPSGDDGFRDTLAIVDNASVDDMGGDGPTVTINARGTLGDFAQTGAPINSLANGFIASMPFFSRPARKSSRSIDLRYFEGYSIGDVFTVSDEYARDPDTGLRGVQTRYGLVLRHWYSLGGKRPGSDQPEPMGGGVDLFFFDVNRAAAYVPCAQVDETQTNGGYNAATNTLTMYAHKYSESTEAVDASHFVAGDKVDLIEIDPSDPTAGAIWSTNTVLSVSGNAIELDDSISGVWDSAKRYRLVFSPYASAVTAQRTKAFQADDADNLVQNLRAPFEYGVGGQASSFTAWSASDMVELPPNAAYGDGVGRDTGHEFGLIRLLNNLYQYKTCISSPLLSDVELNTALWGTTATYKLVQACPIFLTHEVLLNSAYRNLSVAPHFKSASGSSSVRVSLCKSPPLDTDMFDVDRGTVYSEVTFTTSSTTYATPTAQDLDMTLVKNGLTGCAWLIVECTENARTWGLAHVQEGPVIY